MPWSLAVLLGTATSFIVGFKNAQTYSRTVEAQQVWSAIASASRVSGNSQPGLSGKPEEHEDARQAAPGLADGSCADVGCFVSPGIIWESVTSRANTEYRRKFYSIPETESPLEVELAKYTCPRMSWCE